MKRTSPYNFRLLNETKTLLNARAEREGKKLASLVNEILFAAVREEKPL